MTDQVHPDEVAEVSGATTQVRWYGVVLLIGHLALVVIGAVALWRIADGQWLGIAVAAGFVLGYLAVWRTWLAPGSRSRLGYRERLTLSLILGPAVVVLGSLAGLWVPALAATCVLVLGDALNERDRAAR